MNGDATLSACVRASVSCPTTRKFLTLGVVEARSKGTNAGCCHDAIFQSTDQLFAGRSRSTTATAGHHHVDTTPIYIIGTLDSQRLLFVI